MLHYISVCLGSTIIRRLYQLTLSDHAQASLQLTVSFSELAWRFLSGQPLPGDPKKFFLRGPKPISVALVVLISYRQASRQNALQYVTKAF